MSWTNYESSLGSTVFRTPRPENSTGLCETAFPPKADHAIARRWGNWFRTAVIREFPDCEGRAGPVAAVIPPAARNAVVQAAVTHRASENSSRMTVRMPDWMPSAGILLVGLPPHRLSYTGRTPH